MKLLVIRSPEHATQLLMRYAELRVPKEHMEVFKAHLLGARNSYFLEVGEDEGLVYFTNIWPRFRADFGLVFWDGKLSASRRASAREAIVAAFQDFELIRMQADISARNVPMKTTLRKLGFVLEGTRRNDWVDEQGPYDRLVFGMLRQEL